MPDRYWGNFYFIRFAFIKPFTLAYKEASDNNPIVIDVQSTIQLNISVCNDVCNSNVIIGIEYNAAARNRPILSKNKGQSAFSFFVNKYDVRQNSANLITIIAIMAKGNKACLYRM